jgi:protein-tyrosine-phosphatase
MSESLKIVTLCTGNVARSVMLGYMLTTIGEASGLDWQVRTAGTHVIEGSAMSGRTRDALARIDELGSQSYSGHRSHQITGDDVRWADVILASEANHVHFVQRSFPHCGDKTVQLAKFARGAPLDGPLDRQLAVVALLTPSPEFDVADPAGGDQGAYDACAQQLWELSQVFAMLVTEQGTS